MEILYFFQEIETPMFQWQRTHFIDELQHHNCNFTCLNPLAYRTPDEANESLIKHLQSHKYDLFFTNVCYEKVLFPSTVDQVRSMGIPTLCLRCDNLTIPFNDKVLAPHFDLVWLTANETKYLYDKWKVNSFFAPYAANPFFYKPFHDNHHNRRVCFIGTPYGSRSIMINTLSRNGIPIDVYYKKTGQPDNQQVKAELKSGLLWPSRFSVLYHRLLFPQGRKVMIGTLINKIKGQQTIIQNEYLSSFPQVLAEQQSSIYSSYSLCLSSSSSSHTDVLNHPLMIINLRGFEIPMSGGLEFCKFNPELAEYFAEDEEIVFYRTDDEFIDKASYYLKKASDKELSLKKQAARRRAVAQHTWWSRFSIAFDKLGLKH